MRRLVVVALVFMVACNSAPSSAHTLLLTYHKGDVYRFSYQSTSHEIFGAFQETLNETAQQAYTVISVDSSGNADMSVESSNVVSTATAGQLTLPMGSSNSTFKLRVAADGGLLSQDLNGSSFGGATWAVLPDGSVKPGDSWSKAYDTVSAGYSGSSRLATTSKYLRDESFQGSHAAVVETPIALAEDVTGAPSSLPTPNAADGSQTATFKGTAKALVTTWIDRDAHRILKSHVTATFGLTVTFDAASGPTEIKGDVTTDLLPA